MKTPRALLVVGVVLIGFSAGLLLRRAAAPAARAEGAAASSALQFFRNPPAVPSFTLRDLDGQTISSSSFRGKVTLINFWATWCPPCRAEIPDLVALQAKYRGQLQIIGISEDDAGPDVVRRFADEQRMNYAVAMTSREVDTLFAGVEALPTSFLVDREGRVVQRHVGMLSPARIELEVRALAGLPVDVPIEQIDDTQQVASLR